MKRFLIVIIILMFSLPAVAGECRYFDQHGTEVTKEQWQEIAAQWRTKIAAMRQPQPIQLAAAAPPQAPPPVKAKPKSELDYMGRPLRDSQGRLITYPGDEKPNYSYSYATGSSNLKNLDMTRAVHVKGHYRTSKSGKVSYVRPHTRSK